MEDKIQHSKPVPPFVRFCAANIPMVFDDSLSYYEALCALWKFIQDDVIDVINNNASVTQKWREELTEFEDDMTDKFRDLNDAFDTLKTWVETYFDNLDVQEEINNKLDEMVEDGTLQTIVDAYIDSMFPKVQYIFPENWDDGNVQQGDTFLIKAYGKNILIDCSHENYKDELYAWLAANDVDHLDYFFLTHYHTDHYGNIYNLIDDNYIDENTTVYLPILCDMLINSGLGNTRNTIKAYLTGNDVTYYEPTEDNTVVTISDDFKFRLFNLDRAWLDASGLTDYNNASMIILAEHGSRKVLYSADAFQKPLDRIVEQGYLENMIDLYQVEHHGIEYKDTTVPKLLLGTVEPRFAFIPANTYLYNQNNISSCFSCAYLQDINARMFGYYNTDKQTVFESTPNDFYLLQGKPIKNLTNNYWTTDIYVDINSSAEYPDGSSERPFKDLNQAIGTCKGDIEIYNIHLADGTYNILHPDDHYKNVDRIIGCNIVINGNSADNTAVVLHDGIRAYKCNLTVKDCTLNSTGYTACSVLNGCNATYDNCKFTTSLETPNAGANGIHSTNSTVNISNCVFDHINVGVSAHNDTMTIVNTTFKDADIAVQFKDTNLSVRRLIFTDPVRVRYNNIGWSVINYTPRLLGTIDATSGAKTLNDDLSLYNAMIVETGAVTQGNYYSSIIYGYQGDNFAKGRTYKALGDGGEYTSITIDGTDGKNITISGNIQIRKIYGLIKYQN